MERQMRFICPRAWWYLILVILIRIISQYGLSFQQNFLKGASYSVQPTWENVRCLPSWMWVVFLHACFQYWFFLCHTLATVVFFPFLNSSKLFPASGSLHTWFRLPWMLPHEAPPTWVRTSSLKYQMICYLSRKSTLPPSKTDPLVFLSHGNLFSS